MKRHNLRIPTRRLSIGRTAILLLSLALGVIATGAAMAGEPQRHVTGAADIQARIDQQLDQESADRQAVQGMLDQPGVRRIAESAGLDIQRARSAAALLSGSELRELAASAREVNAGIGADRTITITATTLIIILLIVILLTK